MASHPSSLGMIAIGAVLKRSLKDESLSRKIHNRSVLEISLLATEKPLSQMAPLKSAEIKRRPQNTRPNQLALISGKINSQTMNSFWFTRKQAGDKDRLKDFGRAVVANEWLKDNDPEGVASG
jgi:hypothetical protein